MTEQCHLLECGVQVLFVAEEEDFFGGGVRCLRDRVGGSGIGCVGGEAVGALDVGGRCMMTPVAREDVWRMYGGCMKHDDHVRRMYGQWRPGSV